MENREPGQQEVNAEKWAEITAQIQQASQSTHGNRKNESTFMIVIIVILISITTGVCIFAFSLS